MKKSPSLFQTAAKKYTSFSSDLRDVKRAFLENLTSTQPATAASPTPPGSTPPPGAPPSTAGGEGAPKLGGLAPGQQPSQAAPPAAGSAAAAIDIMDPSTKVITSADGKQTFAINEKVPGQAMILTPEQVTAYNAMKKLSPQTEAVVAEKGGHTTGDILGPLSELSRGSEGLREKEDMQEEDDSEITEVSSVGDSLHEDEEDGEAPGGAELEGEDEGTAEPSTSSSPEMGHPATMGMSSPSAGLARNNNQASGAGTGKKGNASSFGTETNEMSTEKSAGDTKGVDGSYTSESDKEEVPHTGDTTGKPFAKGAGTEPEQDSSELGPVLKDASVDKQAESEAITDPNAKQDAFWVPGDEDGLGGLKDVVTAVSKKNGVPDAQENIVKDPATGALVKKPTTPAHAVPNMRQYVRTNGVPGAPSVLGAGMGHNPVDISDLDGVMGMDTSNDRALNISLNFNF